MKHRLNKTVSGFSLLELLVSIGILGLLAALLLPALAASRQQAVSIQCVNNLRQLYLANTMFAAEHNGRYAPAAPDIHRDGGGFIRWHGIRSSLGMPFDPARGPLADYLPDGRVKECPTFFEYTENGEAPNVFEMGTGGYGYNRTYIGSTEYSDPFPQSLAKGTPDGRIRRPSETVMFADAALPQDGYIIEYGFIEAPHFASPEHPDGNPAFGYASPSIHFRHSGRANVLWADGHITSERWEWAPDRNVYGAMNQGWGVGWFGPRNNYYFTVNDKNHLPQSSAR
jgi:prepilin-type processing-associated H-X9-DG protein/prepilin-type N-terminal cleavage/methylation domain-containing protein